MDELGVSDTDRRVVLPARKAAELASKQPDKGSDNVYCGAAIELPDGKIVTGKNSPLLHAASSCVLNAIKYLAGLPDSLPLLSDNVLESVGKLKKDVFHNRQISLSLNETLVALSVSGPANPAARMAMSMLPQLDGCEMHTSHIPPAGDDLGLRRLGIHLTCDPQFTSRNLFME